MKKAIFILFALLLLSFSLVQARFVYNFTDDPEIVIVRVDNSSTIKNITFTQRPYIIDSLLHFNSSNITTNKEVTTANATACDNTDDCVNHNDNNDATASCLAGVELSGHINQTFNSLNRSTIPTRLTLRWNGNDAGEGLGVFCIQPGTQTLVHVANYFGSGAVGDKIMNINSSCIQEGQNLTLYLTMGRSAGDANCVYETEIDRQTDLNYTIFNEDSLLFSHTTETSNDTVLNFTTEARSNVDDEFLYLTYGGTAVLDYITNVSIEYVYNETINVTILANSTSTELNASCTFNGGTIFPLDENLYFNSSLDNQLNCTFLGYQGLSEDLNPLQKELNVSMFSAVIVLSIFDEETDTLITDDNITVTVITDDSASNFTTNTGLINITGIQSTEVELRYGGNIYRTRRYFITTEQFQTELDLYTVKNDNSSLIVFTTVDEKGQPISNATLKVQRYFLVDNAYLLIGMETIDLNGESGMYLIPFDVPYIFIIEKDNIVLYTGTPTKVFSSSISLRANTLTDVLDSFINIDDVTTSLTYNNETNILSFFWNDAGNLVQSGCLQVKRTVSATTTTILEQCTSSASATIQLNLTSYIQNNSDYTAIGILETNTEFSLQPFILSNFIRSNKLYQTTGKFGLFMSWFLLAELFFVGLVIHPAASILLFSIGLIVISITEIGFLGTAVVTGFIILGVVVLISAISSLRGGFR